MTTARPMNSGIEPRTSAAATISPQSATAAGLSRAVRERSDDGGNDADVAVEQQRKRDDGEAEHQRREAEADEAADDDERPSSSRGQDVGEKRQRGRRRFRPVEPAVKDIRNADPGGEDRKQPDAQRDDRGQRRRAKHREHIPPRGGRAGLAPPAHLIEADGEKRPEQREAGGEREDEVERVAERGQPDQHDSRQRVKDSDEDADGSASRGSRRALPSAPQGSPWARSCGAGPGVERLGAEIDVKSGRHD